VPSEPPLPAPVQTSDAPSLAPTEDPFTASPSTSGPVLDPTSQCGTFNVACTNSLECCSGRCLFDKCQRPFLLAAARPKLSEGRSGAGGVTKRTTAGGVRGVPGGVRGRE
jgi:hypothetical protein